MNKREKGREKKREKKKEEKNPKDIFLFHILESHWLLYDADQRLAESEKEKKKNSMVHIRTSVLT